jgi:hypothetical protein
MVGAVVESAFRQCDGHARRLVVTVGLIALGAEGNTRSRISAFVCCSVDAIKWHRRRPIASGALLVGIRTEGNTRARISAFVCLRINAIKCQRSRPVSLLRIILTGVKAERYSGSCVAALVCLPVDAIEIHRDHDWSVHCAQG